MIQRLNVRSTVQKSRLYVGERVAIGEDKDIGRRVTLYATNAGLILQSNDSKLEVYIPYGELLGEATEVI